MSELRTKYMSCCGIREVVGVDNYYTNHSPESFVAYANANRGRSPFVLFSSVTDKGLAVAKYIEEHKLGQIVSVGKRVNRNSGNRLQAWLWAPEKAPRKRVVRKTTAKKSE